MIDRRFHAGQQFAAAGVTFRVVQGKKNPNDLRLDWQMRDGMWLPVGMAVGCMFADFFYENEDVLYPPTKGPPRILGGEKYMKACRLAVRHGWVAAAQHIDDERRYRQRSLFEADQEDDE